jgi:hypothetical protein
MKTWTKDNVCWPRDLLSKEETLSHARVLTFGYDADIVNVNGHASLNSLFDHSHNLLLELSQERRDNVVSLTVLFKIQPISIELEEPTHHFRRSLSRWDYR